MRKGKGRARIKGSAIVAQEEAPRAVPSGAGTARVTRSTAVSHRENVKDQSLSSGSQQRLSKKRKLTVLEDKNCEDANCISPSKVKMRKIKSIIQNAKNQRTLSSKVVDLWCHQCQLSNRGKVVNCNMCRRKFCIICITKWYPLLSEEEVAEKCPSCRGYCNCIKCLRKSSCMPSRRDMCSANEVEHAWHVIRYLYPWLRELNEHQVAEKRKNAEIKGVDSCDLLIPKAKHKSDYILCYKCNAHIVDFHWSCRNCTCIFCLSCCRELLEPDVTLSSVAMSCLGSEQRGLDSDDSVCEIPVLELKSVLGENFISKLYEEITGIITNNPKFEESVGNISKCSCSIKSIGKVDLYCPTAKDVEDEHISHFCFHWVKGEPLIVRDVLELSSGLSWAPMVMWRILREKKNSRGQGSNWPAIALNCRDWSDMKINMHHFFMGFQKGFSHSDGWPQLLRLKYCHNGTSLAERSRRHEGEFMHVLPFPEYTDPQNGPLNLVSYLKFDKLIQQLGPKIDSAYGIQEELGEGDSVIKLRQDLVDVVNVLMHTEEVHLAANEFDAITETHKLKNDDMQKVTITDEYGGALWDVWRRDDVPKLRDYLTNHARDLTNCDDTPSSLADDLLCNGSLYLTMEHKRKLKDKYGIEAWTFEQKLGDAVFVPAGCPYQVRNLKSCIHVTLGFVSPESFQVCLNLADELCLQSRAEEDKLKVKEMAVCALEKAISRLKSEMQEVDNQTVESRNSEEVKGNTILDSGRQVKSDSQQDMINVVDPELHSTGNQGLLNNSDKNRVMTDVPKPDNKLETRISTDSESEGSDGDSDPQKEPNDKMVATGKLDLVFNDFPYSAPDPEFHDFDGDRVDKLFEPNQIWAVYGENDGMPRFYSFIQKVSRSPFEVRMAFLSSHDDSEFGDIEWVSRGFEKSCGQFRLCQYEETTDITMFSHQIKWTKGQNGVIKIFPQKGDIWALYRNWSPDWNSSTPDEAIYKYDIVEVLEEYSEQTGITVAPLVQVKGFNAVFRKDPDPAKLKQIPRKEMFRFCYQVPSYRLTDDAAAAAAKGENLSGCVELDPAAVPLELLGVTDKK